MIILFAVAGLVLVLGIGFFSLFRDIGLVTEKHELMVEFRNRFIKFAVKYFDDGELDNKEYQWLLENVDEISSLLGGADTMTYRPAYANYVINNYQLLINLLPSFNSSMGAHRDDATSADSILTRYSGSLGKRIAEQRKKLRNPINWLLEGVAIILSMPLLLLKQFGILSKNTYSTVRNSGVLRFISGLIALVSAIDTAYIIMTRNSFTVELVTQTIDKIFN